MADFKKEDLREKALITGASSGIGKAFAFELGKAGYDLVLVARRGDLLKKIASGIKQQYGVSVSIISLDLSRLENAEKLSNKIKEIDLLVNDAGVGLFGGFLKSELQSELKMIDLNIKTLYFLTKTYGARMVKRGKGGIINLASLAAFNPYPDMAIYTASKSFVLNYTLAISEELRNLGVRVMALCPGSTATEFFNASTEGAKTKLFKMGGIMAPEAVAKEAWQAFQKGKQICIPGRLNKLMKGMTSLMPVGLFMKMIHGMMKEFD